MDELSIIRHIDHEFEYNFKYILYILYIKIRVNRQEKWFETPGV